jgi:hypothetical protein
LTTSPKSSQASRSKTELKPLKLARSQHDRKASNTRFDNNSVSGLENQKTATVSFLHVWTTFRCILYINNIIILQFDLIILLTTLFLGLESGQNMWLSMR